MRKLIAICTAAVVVLVGIVLTSTASAISIRNRSGIFPGIGQLWGSGLASTNCYTDIYSWTIADASTFVVGDIGSFSASSVMGLSFVNVDGILYLAADAATPSAQLNSVAGPADLGGVLLTPEFCTYAATVPWMSDALTLDGQFDPSAQWVFQIGTALTMPADTMVSLINSASTSNMFWQIGSSLTLGVNSVFAGNIIVNTNITLKAERGEGI